jgi:hypothetical protein
VILQIRLLLPTLAVVFAEAKRKNRCAMPSSSGAKSGKVLEKEVLKNYIKESRVKD